MSQVYAGILALSRSPALFGSGGFRDDIDGRFESLTGHAAVAVAALRRQGRAAEAQEFVAVMFEDLDAALRELGVGDHSIARRARSLGERFSGRALAYGKALQGTSAGGLEVTLARNIAESHELAPNSLRVLAKRLTSLNEALGRADLSEWPKRLAELARTDVNS